MSHCDFLHFRAPVAKVVEIDDFCHWCSEVLLIQGYEILGFGIHTQILGLGTDISIPNGSSASEMSHATNFRIQLSRTTSASNFRGCQSYFLLGNTERCEHPARLLPPEENSGYRQWPPKANKAGVTPKDSQTHTHTDDKHSDRDNTNANTNITLNRITISQTQAENKNEEQRETCVSQRRYRRWPSWRYCCHHLRHSLCRPVARTTSRNCGSDSANRPLRMPANLHHRFSFARTDLFRV